MRTPIAPPRTAPHSIDDEPAARPATPAGRAAARHALPLVVLAACAPPPEAPPDDELTPMALPAWELDARDRHDTTPIALRGRVVDLAGAPIPGADVAAGGLATSTDAEGRFTLDGLPRINTLVRVVAPGHQPEAVLAVLDRHADEPAVALPDLPLAPDALVRFVIAGDTSLGRRYLDPDEVGARDALPPDDAQALIQVSDPLPGSRAVFDHVRDWLTDAEVFVLNLETVVTDRPFTPHPTKDYVIFTLPESMAALVELGVDWIGLGNNHVYDYLEPGVDATLSAVRATGVPSGGMGRGAEEAFAPSDITAGGARWRFIAASSVHGRQHVIDYQADDHSGGAADLDDEARMADAIADALDDGAVPIAYLHTGVEYTDAPTELTAARIDRVAADGAAFIVATHPHTAQGFGWHGDTLAAWSLGNFAFDQDRLETYQALVLVADLAPDGQPVHVRAQPIYVEDYVPRLLGGELADLLSLRVAEHSTAAVVPGFGPTVDLAELASVEEQAMELTVDIGADGVGLVDLRGVVPSAAWLVDVLAPAGVSVAAGRDLLGFGDFEDHDLDDDDLETARWYLGGSSKLLCRGGAYRGAAGLCSHRAADHADASLWNLRERVRVAGDALGVPVKDQWLVARVRGEGAGELEVELTFQASEGDADFGEQRLTLHDAGTYDWQLVAAPIAMPADGVDAMDPTGNARAVRLSFRHQPPPAGEGWLMLDDVAVVSWTPPLNGPLPMSPARFLRVTGPPGATKLRLTLGSTQRGPAPG